MPPHPAKQYRGYDEPEKGVTVFYNPQRPTQWIAADYETVESLPDNA